ncbi:MAG: FAD-binding protein [Endozoicomonas sp.]|uniref:FAD-binding protein n=1 Tax=Endozoicomonas sp. TaxID=1892382 RepID=UPI003D9B62B5
MITMYSKQLAGTMLGILLASTTVAQTFCPALSHLATSCRDGVCRADAGENALNCPEDCADKNSQLLAYYTQGAACPPTKIHEPQSVSELQDTIRNIVSSGRKVKPAGTSHSATDVICADNNGEVVRSKNLVNIGPVEAFEAYPLTVEVESGVEFQDLQEHLAKQGYSHGMASTGYGGISIGGAIATGAHGSSLSGPSTISSYVVALDVVGADGKISRYSEGTTGKKDPDLWRALKTNMGLLGFVARARLKVEAQYNMRVDVRYVDEEKFVNSPSGVADAVADCDYVFLTWFPGEDTVQYLCGSRTSDPVDSPYAQNQLFAPAISDFQRDNAVFGLQLAMCSNDLKCSTESTRLQMYKDSPPLVIASDATPGASVESRHTSLVGPVHRMITLQKEVFHAGSPPFSQLEYEGAMPMSQIQHAVQYLKSIYDRDNTCQPLIGTIMRFDVADDGLMVSANHARPGVKAGEKMVHLEFVEYMGYGLESDGLEKWVSTPYTEIIKHLASNFNYWPHWGKNDEWVFTDPAVMSRNQQERSDFNTQIAKLDPYGVFSTQHSRRNGFQSPKEGEDFAETYFGYCVNEDSDDDGINNCVDRLPDEFSGMYARINDDGVISGTCSAAGSWDEMKGNFGADQQQHMRAGWAYETKNHSYHASSYNWNPEWPKNGDRSWEVMLSGEFTAEASGRYCFSQDNGSTGSDIINGWNACGQVWVDKNLTAEVGYKGANKSQGCVDLVKGQSIRLDIYNRHHNANLSRSFISRPQWCFGGSENCTPDRQLEQNDLRSLETL